ncbi:MAG TPA: TIM barrel protein [Bryobacteraceae bacterium]|nr:TIM barrel protein [Bryobacteraceae bacterium]
MEETDITVWPPAERVLEEIAAAGYDGTELGPSGYLPTEVRVLRDSLARHRLTLTSAFVPLRWFQADRLPGDIEALMQVADLLAALDCPFVVVADGMAPAGEPVPAESAWRKAATTMEDVARRVGRLGLRLVFHLEAGSHLATPDDQARLCALTDPELVGICLDTGHYAYSFGNPRDAVRQYGRRIRYVHLKDVDPALRERVARDGLDFYTAVRSGVFTPLGDGCAEIAAVVSDLLAIGYEGWMVTEQDVLMPLANGRTPLENARQSRDFLRQIGL